MRPFGEAKSISGHQTLQLRKRPYGVKGSMYVVTLPALQRCLEDGPDAAERRPRSGFPTSRGTGDGHLEAHHDLQATPARPGKVTRLGVRGSIVPAASRTSYSSFYKENKQRIEQLALGASVFLLGKGSLFCNGKKSAPLI
ncbi:hypothetical protein ZeamMp094 (mitochondrion) [Zea mays subsp. mays]|uniref:Uncharacterized protein orf140-b n=1 Tax=Zea mays TaxID=4577 RepID=Q6R9F3_MAIZE|nr:hypothetical protein ZeamMp094 [Zea mays subsp. mays]AAR91094.1 hypothetical protein [Zea mays]|eukprot:YP_588355.1 hypothetical protein ZeamMp094 (mitochondrion) [Zea mays subsp. mays]